jgi:hypothetical protein
MEIADMEFWRGEAYTAYVDYLESTGGFFYEVSLLSERHPGKSLLTPPLFLFSL